MTKIVIYYPSEITGGAEFLLKTAAEILSTDFDVTLADIENGWLKTNCVGISSVTLSEGEIIELDEDVVLITTANHVRRLDNQFSGPFKIIAWIVHPYNIVPILPKIGSIQYRPRFKKLLKKTVLLTEYSKLERLVSYLEEHCSLYVMDDACNSIMYSYYNRSISRYLPVAISDQKFGSACGSRMGNDALLTCVWLGRIDGEFKDPILKRVLSDINHCAQTQGFRINFDIIGNGPGLESLRAFAVKLKSIEIKFLMELRGEALKNRLSSASIGFAMGTSALEIAANGVPTILLDASYSAVSPSYRYRWLFESDGYTLGRIINASIDQSMGNRMTMLDALSELVSNMDDLGRRCRQHTVEKHSQSCLRELLRNAIQSSTSNFEHMRSHDLIAKPHWQPLKNLIGRLSKLYK